MNNFSVIQSNCGDETADVNCKSEIPTLLPLLPALSTQACPMTIIRENSTLTKRISYSENLKERLSFQRPVQLDIHGKEISFYKCHQSSFGSVTDNLKYIRESYNEDDETINSIDECLCQGACQNEQSKNLQMEVLKQKNSFKECQQIILKIQRKISSKSLKKSKLRKVRSTSTPDNGELLNREKLKQKVSAAGLFKNEHIRKNNIQCKACKKCQQDSCYIKIKKQDVIQEQLQVQREKRHAIRVQYGNKYGNVESLKKVPREIECDPNNNIGIVTSELKSVYYSEKQSPNVEDVPGAPPCTPNEVIVNGIASLSDIKSQRNVQQKLRDLRNKHAKKERAMLEAAKVKEIERKLDEKKRLMETQRRQIYAANKILAEIEYKNFLKSKTQIQGLPV